MSILVCDPLLSERLLEERRRCGGDRYDEVWDGVYVMSPLANNEHQELAFRLAGTLQNCLTWPEDRVFAGCNVSDREDGWEHQYRCPDVAVFLRDNPARDCGTHWCGGPDLVVEVISTGDRSREKFAFYGRIGVREILLVDRDPWRLELYRRDGEEWPAVGISTVERPQPLSSTVLPVVFRLVPGPTRPLVEIRAGNPETVHLA